MTDKQAFLGAINKLEAMLSECVGLANADASDQRIEMLRLRRSMTDHTHKTLEIGLKAFNSEASRNTFHTRYSELLSAIARHQSEWPISAYNPADVAYTASLLRMHNAYQNFVVWITHELTSV